MNTSARLAPECFGQQSDGKAHSSTDVLMENLAEISSRYPAGSACSVLNNQVPRDPFTSVRESPEARKGIPIPMDKFFRNAKFTEVVKVFARRRCNGGDKIVRNDPLKIK